jgi:environmental stress-induced protein Ves
VRVIRASEYRRMRWKNGLGETAEIAIAPEGAALERFAWRVSMARIEAAGPFSAFPGIDRTLTVLDGAGFRLAVDGLPVVELTPESAPFPFRGDSAAAATLLGGTVTDLNVMTRRADWWHRVRRFGSGERVSLRATGATALVVCAVGSARLTACGATAELGALDTLLLAEPSPTIEAAGATPARLLLVEIGPR